MNRTIEMIRTTLLFTLLLLPAGESFGAEALDEASLRLELTRNSFANVAVSSLESKELYDQDSLAKATHFMNLSILVLRSTGWTRDQALAHLKEIARIYNTDSCRILIRKAFVIETDPYQGITVIDWGSVFSLPNIKGVDIKIADQFPQDLPRPAIVLVRSVLFPADTAYSAAAFKANPFPNYVNSTWIPVKVNDPNYIKSLPEGYDPVAHELAHLLGNVGHNNLAEPNILNDDFSKINDKILPEQCTRFVQSPMVFEGNR